MRHVEAKRDEAFTLVAGGAGHQLNNILQAVVGHAELIAGGVMRDGEARGAARAIRRLALRAAGVIDKLIRFSRVHADPRLVDLATEVREIVPELEAILPATVRLAVAAAPERAPVMVDRSHVRVLLRNLVANARDAMPDGGVVTVAVRRLPGGPEAGTALLEVVDEGTGLDPQVRAHLFEPFFTTRPGAAGLGLAAVHEVVQECGGSIHLESELGRGTRVRVELPLARTETEPGETAMPLAPVQVSGTAPRPAPAAVHAGTVLLAEDDAGVAHALELQLASLGYEVRSASSGDEALDLVRSGAVTPDVLLTDLMMPGLTGTELAGVLRASRPDLPVLYMTGLTSDAVASRVADDPHAAFLLKPFSLARLAESLRALHGAHAPA